MKKRSILRTLALCSLIVLILFAMRSPWAYRISWCTDIVEQKYIIEYSHKGFMDFYAGRYLFLSFALAQLSLIFAAFSVRYRPCGRICGSMLLFSAAALIYENARYGYFTILGYTPLTRGILAALILLGVWVFFAFRKKPRAQDAQGPAEAES